MNYNVTNYGISVGNVRIIGVTSSSVFLIGDAEDIKCASAFDTPPESLIIGQEPFPAPLVPLTSESA
ncbi:MAG TPA: spore gernimation protein GerPD [Bacillales bacterium]|nr:spore gernimation protein GerPD [Bacillales bacterium]